MFTALFGKKKETKTQNTTENINKIRDSIDVLDKKISLLNRKIKEECEKAQNYMNQKNKNGALTCLKRKKMYESQITSFENQKMNLESIIIKLEEAIINKSTISSIQQTNKIFKDISQELSIDKIEKIVDESTEHLDNLNDISNILSNPLQSSTLDDDELLDEFLDEQEETTKVSQNIFKNLEQIKIPNKTIDIVKTKQQEEDEEFEKLEREFNSA